MALGATSAEVQAATPRATQPITTGEQIASPIAVDVPPTDTPQPAASPPAPSPTEVFMWPTMTPVQLGIVTKPSPVAVQRAIAQPAAPAAPHSAAALPTRLIIPTLGLDVPIKEVFIVDDQWEVAEYAAGYLNGSGLPGVPGNLALSGHAGLYGAVFANLGSLNPGDDIFVDAAGVRYHYRLRTASAFWPNQTEVLDSTETPTMTLITCTNWDTQRLVAQADFVDSGAVPDA
jgi:sortase A